MMEKDFFLKALHLFLEIIALQTRFPIYSIQSWALNLIYIIKFLESFYFIIEQSNSQIFACLIQ